MNREVNKVENPIFLSFDEIKNKYWGNWVVATNQSDENFSGIVRYYCSKGKDKIYDVVMELDKDYETYGECSVFYVGERKPFLGVGL
ncbi:MAG: hypothetical protein FWG83_07740 [Oscillospiraceae bacterium]|nr:hypothetical protein [Oscillospiraceae bacterium]